MRPADFALPISRFFSVLQHTTASIPRLLIFIYSGVAEVQKATEFVTEGQELLLICSVDRNPKNMNFYWYKKRGYLSSGAKYKIASVKNSDAGEYYCRAGSFTSKPVTIKVRGMLCSAACHLRTRLSARTQGSLLQSIGNDSEY